MYTMQWVDYLPHPFETRNRLKMHLCQVAMGHKSSVFKKHVRPVSTDSTLREKVLAIFLTALELITASVFEVRSQNVMFTAARPAVHCAVSMLQCACGGHGKPAH